MGKSKKSNKISWLSHFISSDSGQRFFNFAYSIGAAIVILGALFKILHMPLGNTLLSIGMGTEVVMFLLTAFDRPPRTYNWEQVFPQFEGAEGEVTEGEAVVAGPGVIGGGVIGGGVIGGGGVIAIGGSGAPVDVEATEGGIPQVSVVDARRAVGIPDGINLDEEQQTSLADSISKMAAAADQLSKMAELTCATQRYLDQMASISEEMERLRNTTNSLNNVSEVLLQSYDAITRHSNEISESSNGYVEEMQNLNRNISGLNTIYEIQLKSVSSQLDAIDRVNRGIKEIRDMYERSASQSSRYCEETEKMTSYMHQLNSVYENMLTAMTINMGRPFAAPQAPAPAAPATPAQPEYE